MRVAMWRWVIEIEPYFLVLSFEIKTESPARFLII
jgi:hypothetical protein